MLSKFARTFGKLATLKETLVQSADMGKAYSKPRMTLTKSLFFGLQIQNAMPRSFLE